MIESYKVHERTVEMRRKGIGYGVLHPPMMFENSASFSKF